MIEALTASQKVQLLRYASSFVIAAYCKYASFLKIRKPCIWIFLLCRPIYDFLRVYQALITHPKSTAFHSEPCQSSTTGRRTEGPC